MTHTNASEPAVGPRATHYVSLTNGGIYPAMSSPTGHEDANPTDWRPAQPAEIARYIAGEQAVDVSPVPLGDAAALTQLAAPTTIQLTPDDPAGTAPVPPAPMQFSAPPTHVPHVIGEAPVAQSFTAPPAAPSTPSPAPVAPIPPATTE